VSSGIWWQGPATEIGFQVRQAASNAVPEEAASRRHLVLLPQTGPDPAPANTAFLPYVRGLDGAAAAGEEPTAILRKLGRIISEAAAAGGVHGPEAKPAAPAGADRCPAAGGGAPTHLVMRQQLFCNASVAQVMFELTNALIELRVPTVPQDEHQALSRDYVCREEALFREGAPGKYERVFGQMHRDYDPENAITVHFTMLKSSRYAPCGVFSSLGRREVLYVTGNHTVTREGVRLLGDAFEAILAPSAHVLRPYLEAGLSPNRGATVPHGIDPSVFCPQSIPFHYPTERRFRFLQASFPWLFEKGFDVSVKAFTRAFSEHDDVALVLKVPRLRDPQRRASSLGPLEAVVREATAKPGAPEILLLESDVPLNSRGGVYTGADCYLFPLRAEGFAMTILEAMACGLPVVATPWSGPADFLSPRYAYTIRHSRPIPDRNRDGSVRSYHVEPDLDHLVHLMRHIYENRDEAKAMGRVAADVARGGWTWKHAAAKLAAFFALEPEWPRTERPP